jgi:hypothetical protein
VRENFIKILSLFALIHLSLAWFVACCQF